MKALREIKERAEAFDKVIKDAAEITPLDIFVAVAEFSRDARRDIPRLCEALEYLLSFLTTSCEARDVVEQILSGTTEKGEDANDKED